MAKFKDPNVVNLDVTLSEEIYLCRVEVEGRNLPVTGVSVTQQVGKEPGFVTITVPLYYVTLHLAGDLARGRSDVPDYGHSDTRELDS